MQPPTQRSPEPDHASDPIAATPSAQRCEKPRRTAASYWLLAVSVVLSSVILGRSVATSVSSLRTEESSDTVTAVHGTSLEDRLTDEEYRAVARRQDDELLATLRRRRADAEQLPSSAEARGRWEQQVEAIREQLRGVEHFEEGSIAWHRRKELEDRMKDAPPPAGF